jgi:hypothetical protein
MQEGAARETPHIANVGCAECLCVKAAPPAGNRMCHCDSESCSEIMAFKAPVPARLGALGLAQGPIPS